MSTETPPPSIAPQRPAGAPRPGTAPRTVTSPVSGDTAPSTTAAQDGAVTGISFGERLKKAAGAARSALPTHTEEKPDLHPRPAGGAPGGAAGAVRTPATGAASVPGADPGPRRVRLAVARIDPWSVMKLSFLLSFAVGIMIVVAAAVVWYTLNDLAVFTRVNDIIATLSGSTTFFDVLEYAKLERVVSLAAMIAVADIILLTALATIGAFLYNIVAAMVGGIHLTLTDD